MCPTTPSASKCALSAAPNNPPTSSFIHQSMALLGPPAIARFKLVFFVPLENLQAVNSAIFAAGAGKHPGPGRAATLNARGSRSELVNFGRVIRPTRTLGRLVRWKRGRSTGWRYCVTEGKSSPKGGGSAEEASCEFAWYYGLSMILNDRD